MRANKSKQKRVILDFKMKQKTILVLESFYASFYEIYNSYILINWKFMTDIFNIIFSVSIIYFLMFFAISFNCVFLLCHIQIYDQFM